MGHTDAVRSFNYNHDLSQACALSVVETRVARYSVVHERLSSQGVGPLVPVFSNGSDVGHDRNRRVELVERPQ